jgi:aminopeptidase N
MAFCYSRSTYTISVVRPMAEVEVLSNMPPLSEKKTSPEATSSVVTFATTPAMPSYLVCVVVGYYDRISRYSYFIQVYRTCSRFLPLGAKFGGKLSF